jgi:hypothetical protein
MDNNDIKLGDRVLVLGSDWEGTVTKIYEDGQLFVRLDGGAAVITPPSGVRPPVGTENKLEGRTADGRFTTGNKISRKKKNAHYYQNILCKQLAPFLSEAGFLISQIDNPAERVLALSRMLPYALPKLAQIEYNENIKRNYTAEESIAKLNAAYHHQPDPIEEEDDEEEE